MDRREVPLSLGAFARHRFGRIRASLADVARDTALFIGAIAALKLVDATLLGGTLWRSGLAAGPLVVASIWLLWRFAASATADISHGRSCRECAGYRAA